MQSLEEKEVVTTTNKLVIRKMAQNAFSNEKINSFDMDKYNNSRHKNKQSDIMIR